MSTAKYFKYQNRAADAAAAKQAMLERFKARPGPDDPAVVARQAELKAIEDARAAREAERLEAKQAELARQKAEAAAAVAAEKARLAEQKAARDAKYAARKARK